MQDRVMLFLCTALIPNVLCDCVEFNYLIDPLFFPGEEGYIRKDLKLPAEFERFCSWANLGPQILSSALSLLDKWQQFNGKYMLLHRAIIRDLELKAALKQTFKRKSSRRLNVPILFVELCWRFWQYEGNIKACIPTCAKIKSWIWYQRTTFCDNYETTK